MWEIFKPDHRDREQLKSLLTPEEFTQANASILNAHYLNPSTTIYNQGFEKISLPDGYFDMAIGNVPFGSYSVFEPRYDGLLIHNHFISKSMDLVREGGLIALITSTGTLDAEGNKEFRRSLSQKATLIVALRMPGGTMSSAKTQVTTDLLIFKREPESNTKWIETRVVLGLLIYLAAISVGCVVYISFHFLTSFMQAFPQFLS